MTNQKIIVACAVTAVIAGGVGYVGGVKMSSLKRPNMLSGRSGQTMNFRGNNGDGQKNTKVNGNVPSMMGRGGATSGEVTAKDDKSITIKMNDGSSRMVILSDKTTYRMSSDASLDKVVVGTKVAAFGEASADGSVVASNVEINPAMMGQAK